MLWISHNSHFGIIIHSCLGMRMFCRLHLKARSQQSSSFFFHRWLWQCFLVTLSQSFKCVFSAHSVSGMSMSICKLARELWSRMPSLSFYWAVHVKKLKATLKLGSIHSKIEFGSAGCLEKEQEKEYCHFQAWTHTLKGCICSGAVSMNFELLGQNLKTISLVHW